MGLTKTWLARPRHEFSSIPGVREDVTDIVLNIKEIAIKMDGDDAKRMVVRKQGPGVVTAGDIQTVGDIEILNPEHVENLQGGFPQYSS